MESSSVTSGVSPVSLSDLRRYAGLGLSRVRVELTRLRLGLARSPRPLDPDRAVAALPQSPDVLFLCLGNICRSPFAERYLRERLAERDVDRVSVESAGFIQEADRHSPGTARETAPEFGVRLDDHESTPVSTELLRRSDLVFVMDASDYATLSRQFSDSVQRAWFLEAFGGADGYEIGDPNGGDVEEFRAVYGKIADGIDGFVTRLVGDDG